jgi:hypothetical protein
MQPSGCLGFLVFGFTVLAVIFGLSSCSVTDSPAARAARTPELTASLTPAHREAALAGRLVEGMSPDAVMLAWGRPDRVTSGRADGVPFETWRYTTLRAIHRDYWSHPRYGYHRGHYHMMGPRIIDTTPDYVPEVNAVVHFRRGRVAGWETR